MRRVLLLVLLAGAASPAFAKPDSDGENRSVIARPSLRARAVERRFAADAKRRSPGRSAIRGNDDGPRVERVAPVERVEHVAPAERVERVERGSAGDNVRSWRQDSDNDMGGRVRKVEGHPTLPHRPTIERDTDAPAAVAGGAVRNWRERGRNGENTGSTIEDRNVRVAPGVGEAGLVQPRGRLPRVLDPTERRVSRTPMPGTEPPAPRTADTARAHPSSRWRTDWRHDRRYDWRDWRRRHRSRFRLGLYYDPFGWDYLRYGIGWRLWPSYYGSSFWLNDPWQYRLPRAYGPYRWIRYYDDALLVNIYTGEVVDVIYDFFW